MFSNSRDRGAGMFSNSRCMEAGMFSSSLYMGVECSAFQETGELGCLAVQDTWEYECSAIQETGELECLAVQDEWEDKCSIVQEWEFSAARGEGKGFIVQKLSSCGRRSCFAGRPVHRVYMQSSNDITEN
jgi:hypothetical protein